MARRKKGNPVHGWVVLDKPQGMTSTQAVGAVRRLFEAQKAGHAGTLDPLATGILPIALGEATKTVPFAVDGEKCLRERAKRHRLSTAVRRAVGTAGAVDVQDARRIEAVAGREVARAVGALGVIAAPHAGVGGCVADRR